MYQEVVVLIMFSIQKKQMVHTNQYFMVTSYVEAGVRLSLLRRPTKIDLRLSWLMMFGAIGEVPGKLGTQYTEILLNNEGREIINSWRDEESQA